MEGEEIIGGGTEGASLPHALSVLVKWVGMAAADITDKPRQTPQPRTTRHLPAVERFTQEAVSEDIQQPNPPTREEIPTESETQALTDDDLEMAEALGEIQDELEVELDPIPMEAAEVRSQQSGGMTGAENRAQKHKHSTTEYTSEELMSEDGSPVSSSKPGSMQKLA